MKTVTRLMLVGLLSALIFSPGGALQAQRSAPPGFIAGSVRSAQGSEAGVWVIAETGDLQTNFIKIVVTDEAGNFVVPELPAATYRVFVRGYGLVDSKPVQLKPGATLEARPRAESAPAPAKREATKDEKVREALKPAFEDIAKWAAGDRKRKERQAEEAEDKRSWWDKLLGKKAA